MADYSNAKFGPKVFPEHAVEAEHEHLEPMIGPAELRTRHLFGIPLVSQVPDPITKKQAVMTDAMLQDIIEGAMHQAEDECLIDIFPVKRSEKQAFDRNAYESFGYFQLEHRPASSVSKISVTPANGIDVYVVPLEWVEVSYLARGQINIIPMTAAFIQGGFVPQGSTGGAFFLSILGNRYWIPAYWLIDYTSGFKDGMLPRILNELIGTIAAIEVLSQLAITYARVQSHSLGIDGMSQSISGPGPQIFLVRIKELEEKRKRLVNKMKARYGRKMFSSHV